MILERDLFIIISLALTIGIFLICREIVAWYFKINERNSLLRDNNTLLKRIIKQQETLHPELKGLFDKADLQDAPNKTETNIEQNIVGGR